MTRTKGTLTEEEAIELFEMEKFPTDDMTLYINENFTIDLESEDREEKFFISYHRASITLKYTDQLRCRTHIPLLRLDIGGAMHTNPRISSPCLPRDPFYDVHDHCIGRVFLPGEPHIHFYREGYDDRWAYPVPKEFTDLNDVLRTMKQFLAKCNVVRPPSIQRGFFDGDGERSF